MDVLRGNRPVGAQVIEDLKLPEITEKNHWGEYVDACRGQGRTTAGFNYSGPLTEAVLLGTISP